MMKLFLSLMVLPLLTGSAWAAETLNDAQMDRIAGGTGATVIFTCPTCTTGQVFMPTSPQTLFSDLVTFLGQVGYQPK